MNENSIEKDMNELKECPFCGAGGTLIHYDTDGYLARCSCCDGMIEKWFKDREDAINKWNKRAIK